MHMGIVDAFWKAYTKAVGVGEWPQVELLETSQEASTVDAYWTNHTVRAPQVHSAFQSRRYLQWRFNAYPKFEELTELYGEHEGQIVLDYGCGPGNDLVGFALHSRAAKIIGMDVSLTSLRLASRRLALHKVPVDRIQLRQLSDASPAIPLPDESVDFISCQGVLQHTSYPDQILIEWRRILRPGGTACVMVYNRDSVKFHLAVGYEKMVLEGAFPGLTTEEAFSRSTDGPNCPIARCWRHQEFESMALSAGLSCEYKGGYFSTYELKSLETRLAQARVDRRLTPEHRDFLTELALDEAGLPVYDDFWAGVGGVYFLRKL
jgi:ubiquinone/menaquinone biosynthesis C-methylase UbiE